MEKTLKEKIQYLWHYGEWRINVLRKYDYYCNDCLEKGRQKSIMIFPNIPVLYVITKKSINDIIKEYKIINEKDAERCEELWNIDNGICICTECYYKRKNPNRIIANKKKLNKSQLNYRFKKFLKLIEIKKAEKGSAIHGAITTK